MYKNLLMVGAVLFGCMCSSVMAENGIIPHSVKIAPTMQAVQDVNQFDITPEINALRAAKAECDNAMKNSHADAKTIYDAKQKYENIKKQHLENIKNRRRDVYMKGFDVERYAHAWASGYDHYDGIFGIGCPNPEWVLIPGSGHWVHHRCSCGNDRVHQLAVIYRKDYVIINDPHEVNNNYTVHVWVDNGIWITLPHPFDAKKKIKKWIQGDYTFVEFTLVARYRYNDAMIARFLETDMARFRERIEAALN